MTESVLIRGDQCLVGRFQAMGCVCELILDTEDLRLAERCLEIARFEAQRLVTKYSRYQSGNIVDRINSGHGKTVIVDDETAALLDYAATNYELSGGLFDITSGVLRKVWRFDGTEYDAPPASLRRIRAFVGWDRVRWKRPELQLPEGFEIDLGGLAKEYAADKILALLREENSISVLVNLGGDIAAAGKRQWSVGIEDAVRPGKMVRAVPLRQGGIATSGTTKRFVKINSEIYGHILNPKTGWPVKNAPRSVTVAAATCTEAGFWSTLAVLQGDRAESFLREQSLDFWCDAGPDES